MVDKKTWNGKIETFEIYTKDLDAAIKAMSGKWVGFKSRVVDVLTNCDRTLITVESCGRLPFVRNRWNKYIVPDKYKMATGVNALEYKMEQVEKRGRGRPRVK